MPEPVFVWGICDICICKSTWDLNLWYLMTFSAKNATISLDLKKVYATMCLPLIWEPMLRTRISCGLIHAHFVAYHCIVCLTTKNIWTTMTLAHPPTVIFVEKCSSCLATWKITWNHCMRKSFFHLQTTYCGSLLLKFLPSPSSQRDFLVRSVNIPSMTLENT